MAFKKETDWIGVDMDGTLAYYEKGDYNKKGATVFGEPIPAMVQRVKDWIAQGIDVRIVTARWRNIAVCIRGAWQLDKEAVEDNVMLQIAINDWTLKHIGQGLRVGNSKDGYMHLLFDDRAIAIENNTGKILGGDLRMGEEEAIGDEAKEPQKNIRPDQPMEIPAGFIELHSAYNDTESKSFFLRVDFIESVMTNLQDNKTQIFCKYSDKENYYVVDETLEEVLALMVKAQNADCERAPYDINSQAVTDFIEKYNGHKHE